MPKRKLDEISGAEAIRHAAPSKAIRLQQRQLEGLLEQGKKALFRSLKIARGSERQKLGRRQKTAKAESNDASISRLDTEVAALKVRLRFRDSLRFTDLGITELRPSNHSRTTSLQSPTENKDHRL